ncbi:MAG: oxaloacetate-decarboxylating malate dehydrogenase, partial [Pseudomonadota bacterium]
PRAYGLLNKYRDKILCFNDDIQGTAGVALAGIYASTRISKIPFNELRFMFLGAGSAATGIGDLICYALQKEGLSEKEARQRLWFVDLEGLLYKGREDCMEHTLPYLQDVGAMSFSKAMEEHKPHVLIGATAHGGAFSQQVIEQMSEINERPTIFALSNPTDHAECTAEQAYTWSNGRAIFSSGSPFSPVEFNGKTFVPGQGNNAYIFPGVGLAAVACKAKHITEDMFYVAAKELGSLVTEQDLDSGSLYPPLTDIRNLSCHIATLVGECIYENNLAQEPRPASIEQMIRDYMYDPAY